jgi:hypothetical protein
MVIMAGFERQSAQRPEGDRLLMDLAEKVRRKYDEGIKTGKDPK